MGRASTLHNRKTRRGFITNAWLLTGGSLFAMAALMLLLWNLGRRSQDEAGGRELVVYCAAGLIQPVEAIRQEYEREFHVRIQIEPDGSGALLNKMSVVDSRADLFLAADSSYMLKARQKGLVAETIPAAIQKPTIAVAKGNP